MKNRRAKIAAGATVLGLGALGGVALGTNHGIPSSGPVARSGAAPVVTTASGAVVPASQPAVAGSEAGRAPIVTRASGAAGLGAGELDD